MSGKKYTGVIISDKMEKTVVVRVDIRRAHKLYGKIVRKSKKYLVHVPDEYAKKVKVGDLIEFVETRPLSKRKRWIYLKTLNNVTD